MRYFVSSNMLLPMLILGSTSPRRREILSFFSLSFRQESPDFDETTVPFLGEAQHYVQEIAKQKALSLQKRFPKDVILTADTTVFYQGKIFSKPTDLSEAYLMAKELSGQEHQVFTGVCVATPNQLFLGGEESRVTFHELTDDQIVKYHRHILPLDKAGGYAIQQAGSLIVKRIEGCYYNIMGLPIHTVRELLLKAGIDLWDYLKSMD